MKRRKLSTMPDAMRKERFKVEISRAFREKTVPTKQMGKGGNMGYRSNVAYTIRFTGDDDKALEQSFCCFLAEAKLKFPSAVSDTDLKIDEKNFRLNFFASDVKWYEDYEDVKCHMSLLQLAQDWAENVDEENGDTKGNKYIGGIFVRVGENADDVTEEGFGEHDWDWVRVHREVVCDWEV